MLAARLSIDSATSHLRVLLRPLFGFGLLLPLVTCSTAKAEENNALKSPHTEESSFVLGLKGIFVRERADEAVEQGAGLGAFFETTLIEHWLELEIGATGVFPGETAAQLAFEPVLKLPFEVARGVNPYLGVGPVFLMGNEPPHFRAGGQAVMGSYFWVTPRFGIDLDFGFSLLSGTGTGGIANEMTFGVGPVGRF